MVSKRARSFTTSQKKTCSFWIRDWRSNRGCDSIARHRWGYHSRHGLLRRKRLLSGGWYKSDGSCHRHRSTLLLLPDNGRVYQFRGQHYLEKRVAGSQKRLKEVTRMSVSCDRSVYLKRLTRAAEFALKGLLLERDYLLQGPGAGKKLRIRPVYPNSRPLPTFICDISSMSCSFVNKARAFATAGSCTPIPPPALGGGAPYAIPG
jgi:hypothetical protein